MLSLESSVTEIKGIGEKTARGFQKLGILVVDDLLHYYPRDYETFEEPYMIQNIYNRQNELIQTVVSVRGIINKVPYSKKVRNLTILSTGISDCSGNEIKLTFFNMPFLSKTLKKGNEYILRGLLKEQSGNLVMEQPKLYGEQEYAALLSTLQPVYSLTHGITNKTIQNSVKQVLSHLPKESEYLPKTIIDSEQFGDIQGALEAIHYPDNRQQMLEARRRLVFDEFFLFILAVRRLKTRKDKLLNEHPMIQTADMGRLLEALPYEFTKAQMTVWHEIEEELQSPYIMNRLIQGDVGSGKTIIAVLALLMAVSNGRQGALMAPTEVLAKQHFDSIMELIVKYGLIFKPVLLTGSVTGKARGEIYRQIENGEANLIIGTHALIQERVNYKDLALVVTDEQHRFGVRQREALAGKGVNTNVLVMSATPIPRTLAMIIYGDLEISVIDELPINRKPIKNCVVNIDYRNKAYQFIKKEVEDGRQVYVICPMVEEGELEDVENVTDYTRKLKDALPDFICIEALHGKMKPAEKSRIMEEFTKKNIDILVSTTVIEVGINVPNATVMMVENAERFGLAQLHQLRGRVGRGEYQSYCIFVSGSKGRETMERLNILNKSNDGFFIAEQDLKLRGTGDIFGIRQSGDMNFKLGDIYMDSNILKDASEKCNSLLMSDPELQNEDNRKLKSRLEEMERLSVDFKTL